jgi:hypothetical protein
MKLQLTKHDLLNLALENITRKGFVFDGDMKVDDNGSFTLNGTRTASKSFGDESYRCHHDWPIECSVQCGGHGMVITDKDVGIEDALTDPDKAKQVLLGKVESYRTAFFEAFPRSPDTFIRGEGKTIEEAEEQCWLSYQKKLTCPGHEYDRRDRKDGYCFCKHCGLSGMFMQPLHPCMGCKATEYSLWSSDKCDNGYCKTCYEKLPDEMLSDHSKRIREMTKEML